jgi:hypothetical protein
VVCSDIEKLVLLAKDEDALAKEGPGNPIIDGSLINTLYQNS